MNATAFALVYLTSGFVFLRLWRLSRTLLMRSEGHTLYFLVVWAAFALGALSVAICHDIYATPIVGDDLHRFAATAIKAYLTTEKGEDTAAIDNAIRFGLSAFASMPLSVILAWLLNIPLRNSTTLGPDLLFRVSSIPELDCYLWDATKRSLSVMVTLSSGKVYVGNAIETPKPGEAKTWVRLEPLLSGYRDQSHEFQPTTTYLWIHKERSAAEKAGKYFPMEDFDILLPIDGIQSVHPFSIGTLRNRFAGAAANADQSDRSTDDDGGLAHKARLRPARQAAISREEWVYFAYIFFVVVVPFLFFARAPIMAGVSIFLVFMIAQTFIAGGRMKDAAARVS
ncbi:MAG TPA: hypothetical protein VGH81_10625 [Rudaea sp.]|jgi:hypothetical protein